MSSEYDQNKYASYDTFSLDGGPAQTFDATAIYTATLIYADGSTANISAVVFQDTNGNLYLAPKHVPDADQTSMEAKAILSITLILSSMLTSLA